MKSKLKREKIQLEYRCQTCAVVIPSHLSYRGLCDECYEIKMHEDYMDLEYEEWDGVTPLVLHDGDEYFFSDDDIESYVDLDDERKFEDLDLVICEPVFARLLDEELWWSDDLPDDTTMEDVFGADFTHLMDAMNEILRSKPSCWRQGTKRTSYSPEWRAKNEDD